MATTKEKRVVLMGKDEMGYARVDVSSCCKARLVVFNRHIHRYVDVPFFEPNRYDMTLNPIRCNKCNAALLEPATP